MGNFGFDLMAGEPVATTTVVRVDPDGSARAVADGLCFPNGSFITPDGKTLIVNETFGNRISEFGHPGRRRPRPAPRLGRLRRAAGPGRPAHADRRLGHRSGRRRAGRRGRVVGGRRHRQAHRARERGGRILEQIDTGELGIFAAALRRAGWPHVVHGGRAGLHRGQSPRQARRPHPGRPGRRAACGPALNMRACPERRAGSPPRPAPAAVRRSRGLLPAPPPSSGSMWT